MLICYHAASWTKRACASLCTLVKHPKKNPTSQVIWRAFSSLFEQIQMQSCILAGGVSVGVAMSAVHQPWEAMAIGFTAAIISTAGFKYLKVFITRCKCASPLNKLYIHLMLNFFFTRSTCYSHFTATTPVPLWAHTDSLVSWDGLPSSSCRLKTAMTTQCKNVTNMRQASTTHRRCDSLYNCSLFCRAIRFSVFHISALFITISTSLSMGILTGMSFFLSELFIFVWSSG